MLTLHADLSPKENDFWCTFEQPMPKNANAKKIFNLSNITKFINLLLINYLTITNPQWNPGANTGTIYPILSIMRTFVQNPKQSILPPI